MKGSTLPHNQQETVKTKNIHMMLDGLKYSEKKYKVKAKNKVMAKIRKKTKSPNYIC